MAPIPGANLGQGMPGGRASLPGSLPLPGGGQLGPPPGNLGVVGPPRRPVAQHTGTVAAAPALPSLDPRAAQEVGTGLSSLRDRQNRQGDPASTKNITVALGVLDQVRHGKLRPDKAAKLMQGLTYGDQERLANLVTARNAREGRIDRNELKALQTLQELPAPQDTEPHDLLSNFTRDTSQLITGLPAGIGLAGVYGAKDLFNIGAGRTPTHHFYDKILKPMGQVYKQTYGPLFEGHPDKTLHAFHEHPLQPALDALTVASVGVGGAARLGAASRAIDEAGMGVRATKVVHPLTGEEAIKLERVPLPKRPPNRPANADLGPQSDVPGIVSSFGRRAAPPRDTIQGMTKNDIPTPKVSLTRNFDPKKYTPEFLKQNPWAIRFPVQEMPDGTIRIGKPGTGHPDLFTPKEVKKLRAQDEEALDAVQGTGIFDPETGKVIAVNLGYKRLGDLSKPVAHDRAVDARFAELQQKMLQAARQTFNPEKGGTDVAASETLYHGGRKGIKGPLSTKSKEWGIWGEGLYLNSSETVGKAYAHLRDGEVYQVKIPPNKIYDDTKPIPTDLRDELEVLAAKHGLPPASEHSQGLRVVDYLQWIPRDSKGNIAYTSKGVNPMEAGVKALLEKRGYGGIKGHAYGEASDFVDEENMPAGLYGRLEKELPDSHDVMVWDQSLVSKVEKGGHDVGAPPPPPPEAPPAAPIPPPDEPGLPFAPGTAKKALIGTKAFLRSGGRGGLIDLYDRRRGITHEAEIQETMKQVQEVLDNPDLRLNRRSMGEVVKDVAADIRATRAAGKARPGEMAAALPQFISAGSTGRALSATETTLREASDLVRAGAIYLRPAYLPNNWAGNAFMNVAHQGVFAPVNLAKSFVLDKNLGKRYTSAIDKSVGNNPATVITSGAGRGYVGSLTQPVAHLMGAIADQPFRRAAWLHEARRAGYSKLSQVKKLLDNASVGDQGAIHEIAQIGVKAQEEIVKFGNMNPAERSVIRNLVFVYSWMRGAGRYTARFPMQHPIQTNAFNLLSGPGNQYDQSIMGGVPGFMAGSVPVGRDKNGNPIVINPFSLNPLGTGLQIGKAAAGTLDVIRDPKSFNKYAQQDIVGLLNPLIGSYVEAREGGQPVKEQLERTIAAMALVKGLKHPGSGSIYPTSRLEAIGHFVVGSMYPRVADEGAITRALERENIGHPAAMIPQQLKDFRKAIGISVPIDMVAAYRQDLQDLQTEKDFQHKYAQAHGSSGFRNLPPQNRFEAGIEFLRQYSKVPAKDIDELEKASAEMTNDADYNELANATWNLTGVGQWKDAWDNMMSEIKGRRTTRARG